VRIEKLKRNFEIDVQWAYFPLHPDTPAHGLPLKDLFAGRGLDLEAMHARMKGLMDSEGLPYGRRTHTYNSRLAQELAKWADSQPGFEAIHDALYRAYFVHGRNIGDPEVLAGIAQSVGLPLAGTREVLIGRIFKDAVDTDWEKARRSGITGVPSFIAGGHKLVGAHPYDVLAERLRAAGAQPKSADENQ
jgi:predicted DsbA family dithiol-disulfide isomerase